MQPDTSSDYGDGYGYVRGKYDVPVEIGQRVVHEGGDCGTVVAPEDYDQYVHVRFDADGHVGRCHPLSLDYGDGTAPEDRLDAHNTRIDMWNARLNGRITADEIPTRAANVLRWIKFAERSRTPA